MVLCIACIASCASCILHEANEAVGERRLTVGAPAKHNGLMRIGTLFLAAFSTVTIPCAAFGEQTRRVAVVVLRTGAVAPGTADALTEVIVVAQRGGAEITCNVGLGQCRCANESECPIGMCSFGLCS